MQSLVSLTSAKRSHSLYKLVWRASRYFAHTRQLSAVVAASALQKNLDHRMWDTTTTQTRQVPFRSNALIFRLKAPPT